MKNSTTEMPQEVRCSFSETHCPILDAFVVLAGKDLSIPRTCVGESGPDIRASMARAVFLASFSVGNILPRYLRTHGFDDIAKAFAELPPLESQEGVDRFEQTFLSVSDQVYREGNRHIQVVFSLALFIALSLQQSVQSFVTGDTRATLFEFFHIAHAGASMASFTSLETRQEILSNLAESIPVALEFVEIPRAFPNHADGNHNSH